MSWTNGTWAEVAIGDTVLGGDGYPWRVTDGLIDRFDVYGKGEVLRVTMQRDGAGARTGDVLASKPVKYRATEAGGRYLLSCEGCLRTDLDGPCELHTPAPKPACDAGGHDPIECSCELRPEDAPASPAVVAEMTDLIRALTPREQVFAELQAARGEAVDAKRERALVELANGVKLETGTPAAPKVAPYVEYDESERAAASALKGAGLTMTVIERVMTLDGLMGHLEQIHGESMALPNAGKLTRIEYRSKLADLHFELHAHDQERGQKWAPRGRTPHVHPVMDRPMEDAVPKSLRRR